MPSLVTEKIMDPETGKQARDAQGTPMTQGYTDPNQHKSRVKIEVYDALWKSFRQSGWTESEPIQDADTKKWYRMVPGNAPEKKITPNSKSKKPWYDSKGKAHFTLETFTAAMNEPDKGIYNGPIIEEMTQDEALVVPTDKTPALTEVMERMAEMQKTIDKLTAGAKGAKTEKPKEEKAPEIKAETEAPNDGELDMTGFLALAHWRKQIKAIKDGTADSILVGITQSDAVTKKVKEAALERFEATKEKTE